jgi:non-specific serine/threonine protein kinase
MLVGELEASGGTDAALAGFVAEQDNFRAVLGWAEATGRADVQQELVGRSWPFYWYRGNAGEGQRWVESALTHADDPTSAGHAKVLAAGAMFSYRRGDLEAMKHYAEESLQAARTNGDEALSTWPLILLGLRAAAREEYAEADRLYGQAYAIAQRSGNRSLAGIVLNNLGNMCAMRGDFVGAAELFEQALAISRELRASDEMATYSYNVGFALHQIGRTGDATRYASQSLVLAYEIGAHLSTAYTLTLLSSVAIRRGRAHIGAQLLGAAEALWSQMGEEPEVLEARFMESTAEDAERVLGTGEFSQALTEGRAMTLEEAVGYALDVIDA